MKGNKKRRIDIESYKWQYDSLFWNWNASLTLLEPNFSFGKAYQICRRTTQVINKMEIKAFLEHISLLLDIIFWKYETSLKL